MMDRLRRRAEFLAAAAGASVAGPGFVLQVRRRSDDGPPRIGFTVSRKVGSAVERTRVRRRLREVVRRTLEDEMRSGHDYVLVGRRPALTLPFSQLGGEIAAAINRLHGRQAARPKTRDRHEDTRARPHGDETRQ
jgi:ribonuclease P protein component